MKKKLLSICICMLSIFILASCTNQQEKDNNEIQETTNTESEINDNCQNQSGLFDPDIALYKPVIYLYPEKETDVSVNLTLNGKLTCTYPKYNNGWTVTAKPDGTLTDKNGMNYNYLYWEGETDTRFDFSTGYCVKGSESAKFLEKELAKQGLNRKEANEFITFWLPQMEQNEYNIISFQKETYTDVAKLNVNPNPNTIIRVFMAFKPSNEYVKIPAPKETETHQRNGFTLVEWGGSILN